MYIVTMHTQELADLVARLATAQSRLSDPASREHVADSSDERHASATDD